MVDDLLFEAHNALGSEPCTAVGSLCCIARMLRFVTIRPLILPSSHSRITTPNPDHAQDGLAKLKKKGGKVEQVAEPPLPGSR